MTKRCTVEGCERPYVAKGYCGVHYGRVLQGTKPRPTVDERFVAQYEVAESGCWVWRGATGPTGYGVMRADGRQWRVHRWAHERYIGPIPEGYEVDHLCKNRACVNPGHLEAVTPFENFLRSDALGRINLDKTHCKHGHPYDDANTSRFMQRNGRPRRSCKTCGNAATARYRASRRALRML